MYTTKIKLPKIVMSSAMANLTLFNRTCFAKLILTSKRVMCCPSKWKHGTTFIAANAPENMIRKWQNLLITFGIVAGKYEDDSTNSEMCTPCSTSMACPKNNTLLPALRSISINFVPFANDGWKQCCPLAQSAGELQFPVHCSITVRTFKHEYCGNSNGLSLFSRYSKQIFENTLSLQHSITFPNSLTKSTHKRKQTTFIFPSSHRIKFPFNKENNATTYLVQTHRFREQILKSYNSQIRDFSPLHEHSWSNYFGLELRTYWLLIWHLPILNHLLLVKANSIY